MTSAEARKILELSLSLAYRAAKPSMAGNKGKSDTGTAFQEYQQLPCSQGPAGWLVSSHYDHCQASAGQVSSFLTPSCDNDGSPTLVACEERPGTHPRLQPIAYQVGPVAGPNGGEFVTSVASRPVRARANQSAAGANP
jgi:hypothetical protein